ncbi:MAG TPA: dTDP-glucose 4,6-dehydratase [Longimicrobiaceae bacterium]|nr:dTDP-glucose 4,6-dehydratase [Longimicrobiaceae bacterium]
MSLNDTARILVTGGMGFIGSNFVRLLLAEKPGWQVWNLDLLTYAANPENLADVAPAAEAEGRYRFVRADVADPEAVARCLADAAVDAVAHFAAESHVDRSIASAAPFVRANVVGTQVLLDAARAAGVERFVHVSTDEVYGDLEPDEPPFTEETPIRPSSPYSASKAASDHLALAYHRTHGMDVRVTRCSNNYGPYQFPEKLIPLMLVNALEGCPLPVYGRGENVRDWIHVEDHCRGVLAALERGTPGRVYNFGGASERRNLDVVREIARAVGASEELIRFVTDRPGHDRRYAIDFSRAREELGWTPGRTFEEGLAETVRWYLENRGWWERVRDGAYRESAEMIRSWGGADARAVAR